MIFIKKFGGIFFGWLVCPTADVLRLVSGGRPRPPPKEYYEQVLNCLEIPTVLTPNYGDDLNMSHFFLQYDLDKLEKGSVEWNKAMIRMLLHLKKDGHKIKEYVSGSGNKVSAAE